MRDPGVRRTPSGIMGSMPVFRLGKDLVFPPAELAAPSGLLAVGGDLRPERVLLAYRCGVFPWYEEGLPILWHSPDPRMILDPREIHVPRSLEKRLRQRPYEIRFDTAFRRVMEQCAATARPGQDGTWITRDMLAAYTRLHEDGLAHSIEAWSEGQLSGGLYGVSLGRVFFGESMFAHRPDASKIAFVSLCRQLVRWDFTLVDCQVHTDHLARFGAHLVPRSRYLELLAEALRHETRSGRWVSDPPSTPGPEAR